MVPSQPPLVARSSADGSVSREGAWWRLQIAAGPNRGYRLAQVDDYTALPRRSFPHRTFRLSLRARASEDSIAGTWGFGAWNDSFGFRVAGAQAAARLPTVPNAAWFFHASPESHLSFRDGTPGSGFLAQTFRSHVSVGLLVAAAVVPFSPRTARRLLSRNVDESGTTIALDTTSWHEYSVVCSRTHVAFSVDGTERHRTDVVPRGPLGLVIWIDNQFAAFTPQGRLRFGLLANSRPAWLEVENVVAAPL